MNEIININYSSDRPTVLGRELHDMLEVKTPYAKWFSRMCEYGFSENVDYMTVVKNVLRVDGTEMPQTQTDHQLTIPMAKEICMLQRTERGKECRQYFIRIEEEWNSPDAIMQRALQIANSRVEKLRGENLALQAANSDLTVKNQVMQPKADYFDQLVDRNLLTNFRDTAKQLGIKPRTFTTWLVDHKYLYRDKSGKLNPYEAKNKGLFEVKEFVNEKTGFSSTQTLVTPKGRETFRLLCEGI
ncbi:phage antirepressor KilAC domain-containing protein [Butyricicoccus intestinisimiae]|jgi:anti-repressor protein|uniref:phage antirepressor KilAC domain-containing protein n=1 Tax=Butyricicoccus intestinisimiae TaxID=2841509 RepID=UPI003D8B4E23